jgi:hypothetical protein
MTISLVALILGTFLLALPDKLQTSTGRTLGTAGVWLGLAFTLAAVGKTALFHVS